MAASAPYRRLSPTSEVVLFMLERLRLLIINCGTLVFDAIILLEEVGREHTSSMVLVVVSWRILAQPLSY